MRRITVLFALFSGMVACEEAEQLLGQLEQSQETEDEPAAPVVNPYDYVGEAHNEYLGCTLEFLDLVTGDTPEAQAAVVMDVLEAECAHPPGPELEIARDIVMVEERLDDTGVGMALSDEELDVLTEMDQILRTYEPSEALLRLEQLELDTLQTMGDESVPVLTALSTARASGTFWQDRPDGNGTRAKWWQIVLADAAGALVGTLAGPQGSITLGVTASTLVAK